MDKKENKFGLWLFGFGLAYAFFQIFPALLIKPFIGPVYWGDVLDFLTPFAVIFLVYFLYRRIIKLSPKPNPKSQPREIFFKVVLAVGFILYVNGHGVHLSANAISRFIENSGMKETEIFNAAYLFDEIISHFMWDTGVIFISLGLILGAISLPVISMDKKNTVFLLWGAAFYGFTFTVNGIEGQVVPLMFPAAVLGFFLCLGLFIKEKKKSLLNPVHLFFLAGYLVSTVLFSYWGIAHAGFPEFSALGWI